MSHKVCPACGTGYLIPQEDSLTLTVNGEDYTVPTYYSVCDTCETEVADRDDTHKNAELVREIRKNINRDITTSNT